MVLFFRSSVGRVVSSFYTFIILVFAIPCKLKTKIFVTSFLTLARSSRFHDKNFSKNYCISSVMVVYYACKQNKNNIFKGVYTMYELIREKTKEENNKLFENTIKALNNNEDAWTQENTLNYYLTDLRKRQLKDGTITKEKAIEIATKKAQKEYAKRLENELKHIESVENASELQEIHVIVEWNYCRTYGNKSANARVWTQYKGVTLGHASGGGYDKESSAIASAFNKNENILKILFDLKEKKLQEDFNITTHDACGYGAGYGAIPYYEGGVGTNCFIWILKACGYKLQETHSTNTDVYIFTKI